MQQAAEQRFASMWDAIADTPQEATSLRARSALMMGITEAVRTQGLTQAQAAELFGVTQPRISDLMRGKVNLSLDALVDMASTAGMNPIIKVTVPKKAGAKASTGKTTVPAPKPVARKSKAQQLPAA